ncbi:MAG: hypothetical protein WC980_04585 [Candidatus Brocadiia bacterium]
MTKSVGTCRITTLLLALFLSLASMPAFATDRFFNDITAKSDNGKFIAVAASPDNKGRQHMAFQRNFTFTLSDARNNQIIWTYKQEENVNSPVELIPTDDGYLIMRTANEDYYVFDKRGNPKKIFNVFAAFTDEEIKKFTDSTSAGIMWRQHSKQGFFPPGKKTYFYVRTYWGRIAVIDVADRTWTRSARLAEKIEDSLVQSTKEWLKGFDNNYYDKCDSCREIHLKDEITGNVFIVKKYGLAGGEKILQEVLNKADDGKNYRINDYLKRIDVTPYSPGTQKITPVFISVLIILVVMLIAAIIFSKRQKY